MLMLACGFLFSGIVSYCDRYSDGMKRVLKTFGPVPEFSGATAEKVNQVCGLPKGSWEGKLAHTAPPPVPSVGGALSVATVWTLGSS